MLPIQQTMGQSTSTPDEEETRKMRGSSENLYKCLNKTGVQPKCPITHNKWMSLETLDQHITEESVQACTTLGNLWCGKYDAENIVQRAKKAFAVLSLMRCDHSIIEELLIKEGLVDDDLPLERHGDGSSLVSQKTQKRFNSSVKLDEYGIDMFLEKQWLVLSPVFTDIDADSEICTLSVNCPLPLKDKEHLTSTDTSIVSKCLLHPAHYRSSTQQKTSNGIHVAVKEIVGNKRDEIFKKEVDTLIEIRQYNNPHLIRHIAACRAESDPPLRCIIFPFASGGDLKDYWNKGDVTPRTPRLVHWSLKQMQGLAKGIRDLHSGFQGKTGSNVRHGDLKPQNILIFEDEGEEKRLVVADVGIAKVHMGPTAVRTQKATGTQATTRAYEAPEAHQKADRANLPRSRAYDIWSLGCIFLEFTIWLLFDVHAVNCFGQHRPRTWTESEGPGGFYDISHTGVPGICQEVQRALADLLDDNRCGGDTALGKLVRLISKEMLVAKASDRCPAEKLVKELENISNVRVSEEGDGYFLKVSDRQVSVPEMFCPVQKGSRSDSMTK